MHTFTDEEIPNISKKFGIDEFYIEEFEISLRDWQAEGPELEAKMVLCTAKELADMKASTSLGSCVPCFESLAEYNPNIQIITTISKLVGHMKEYWRRRQPDLNVEWMTCSLLIKDIKDDDEAELISNLIEDFDPETCACNGGSARCDGVNRNSDWTYFEDE
jgi:hypothetical protein